MARVLTYNRPVDVIVVDSFDYGSGWSGTFLKVKEEVDGSKEPTDELPVRESTSAFCNNSDNLSEERCRSNKNSHIQDSHVRNKLQKLKKVHTKRTLNISRNKKAIRRSKRNKWERRKRVIPESILCQLSTIMGDSKNSSALECRTCFLKFDCLARANNHLRNYTSTMQYTCSICNVVLCSKKLLFTHERSTHSSTKYQRRFHCECHFCGQRFIMKDSLQTHIHHFHNKDVYFHTETPMQFSQNENTIDQDDVSKPNFMPRKERDCRYSSDKEDLPTEKCSEAKSNNLLEAPIEDKHTPKKMRQTTLTEFINFCSPNKGSSVTVKKNLIKDLEEKNIKSSPEKSNQSSNLNNPSELKPFVQIHVLPEEYLAQSSEGTSHKQITNRINNWVKRSTRCSSRLSINHNEESDLCDLANVPSVRKSLHLNKTGLNTQPLSDIDTKLAIKYKCKKCSVPLIRCDVKPNNLLKAALRDVIVPAKQQKRSHLPKLSRGGHLLLKELEVSLERLPMEKIRKTMEISEPVCDNQDHRKESFVCKVCDETFCSKEEKKQHMKATHTAYMSSICNARYTFKHKLIEHYLRQHYLFKRNECCVCGEPCSDRMALRRHLLLHCIKITRSKQDTTPVDVEVTCKSYHKTNKCSGCGKSFWLYSCLQQHQMNCQKCKRTENDENDGCAVKGKFPTIQLREADKVYDVIDETTLPPESSNNKNLVVRNVTSTEHVGQTQITSASPSEISTQNMDPNIFQNPNVQPNFLVDPLRFADTNTASSSSSAAKVNDAKTKYYCDICGRQYQTYKNLQQHLRMFTNLIGEPCNICGTVFGSVRLLRAHFNAAHIPEIVQSYNYHCSFCNQGFCKKDSLRMHELHLHSRQLMPVNVDKRANIGTACKVCNLIFECYDRFEEHNMYYNKEQMFSCGFCGQLFRGMYMLHHHNKLIHYPQFTTTSYNYTCSTCGEGFNHETHFYAHKVHVHSVNPLSPDLFNKTSPDKRPMIAMEESVTDKLDNIVKSTVPAYICNVCEMTFSNSKELAYHESQFSDDGSYLCDKCSKRFRNLVFLTKHQVLTHSLCEVNNEFMCNICKEVFTSKVSLTCHEKHFHRNLENTLPLDPTNAGCVQISDKKCSICETEFKTSADLVDHVLQYANHGNYNCDICHRKFYYVTHLEQHKITHFMPNTILSNSGCFICNENFSSIAAANSHFAHLHKHKDLSAAVIRKVINAVEQKSLDISTKNTQTPELNKAISNEVENVDILPSTFSSGPSARSEISENISEGDLKTQVTANDSLISDSKDNAQEVKCDTCNLKFATKKNLYNHCQRFKNKGEYVCEFCGAKFEWESLFSDHHRKHLYEMNGISLEHSCHICDEKFRTAASAQSHIAHCHSCHTQSLENNWKHKEQSSEQQHEPHQKCLQSESDEIQIIDITDDSTTANVDRSVERKDPPLSSESDEVNVVDELLDQADNTYISSESSVNQTRTTLTIRTEEIKIVNEEFCATDNYTCPVCLSTFITLQNFQKHFKDMHPKVSSEYRSRNYSTQVLKVTPETQGIACVICNAVFSNPVGFKKHLNTVHMPRMNFVDNMKKRFVKIIKRIPLVQRPVPTIDTGVTDPDKSREGSSVEEPHTSIHNTSKKLSTAKYSEVKQQNNNVGKLKVKDFAKIIDRQDNAPMFEINKKTTSSPSDKYVILQPETRSEIYFASYINNLSKNGAQKL